MYLFMSVTPPIFWKLCRCFVYGLKRAGGLGMILKLFSTRDLSLLAHGNYRVKKCFKLLTYVTEQQLVGVGGVPTICY